MTVGLPGASSARAAAIIALIALLELVTGALGVRAAFADAGGDIAIVSRLQFAGGALLMLTAIGLLRMRLWAARVTTAVLFVAFFAVLTMMSMMFEQHRASWYYWCLPLLLPVIGSCVHVLRVERIRLVRRL